jgi:hypothetical protein
VIQELHDLDPAVPVALLPVRLETRFTRLRRNGSRTLQVRVYPDDIHSDTHETELTADENAAGQLFWTLTWSAGQRSDAAARRLRLWEQLVERLGPARASWVVAALAPTNPQDRPLDPADPLPVAPDFPTVSERPGRWTRAPLAVGLPDRWLALGYLGGARVLDYTGNPIRQPLASGPDPAGAGDPLGGEMRWMVDFAEAVRAGMGMEIPIPAALAGGLDLLLVVGVRGTETPAAGASVLADLLAGHSYTWGFDLLRYGTPTNNTADAASGWRRRETDLADSYDRVLGAVRATPGDGSDADQLGAALGLTGARFGTGRLDRLEHAAERGQSDAADMATVLWPATWGYFLSQLMHPTFRDTDLATWRDLVVALVRGRGPLPALRIGNQPYGMLPVTSLGRWRPDPDAPEMLTVQLTGQQPASAAIRIGWDLNAQGGWTAGWTPPIEIPVVADAIGIAAAVTNLDQDPRPDLVVLELEAHRFSYRIGWNLDTAGNAERWSAQVEIIAMPFEELTAAAIAVVGTQVIVVASIRGIRGRRRMLGLSAELAEDGTVGSWAQQPTVPDPGTQWLLAGAAAGDLSGTGGTRNGGDQHLVLLWLARDPAGDRAAYQIGRPASEPTQWTALTELPIGLGTVGAEVGITLADLDHDGRPELVVHASWTSTDLNGDPIGIGSYRIGVVDDPVAGTIGTWLGPYNTGGGYPGPVVGASIAVTGIGRGTDVGLHTSTAAVNLLETARDTWRSVVDTDRVPRTGRAANPDQDLLDILSIDGLSSAIATRNLLGPQLAQHLWLLAGLPLDPNYRARLAGLADDALVGWGLPGGTRLGDSAFASDPVEFGGPLVSPDPVAEDEPLRKNYLKWAAEASPQELHDHAFGVAGTETLLYQLVRHSTLQAYADAAFRLVPPPDGFLPEPELVDLSDLTNPDPPPPVHTLTSWRHLSETQMGGKPLGDVVRGLSDSGSPRAAEVSAVRAALRRLAELPTAALERLLMETLDLASYRLDAWLTAVATKRLRDLRVRTAAGVHLGGYAFVEQLAPTTGPASTGYVHAPSLAQATTAAVLRSGYLTHASAPQGAQLAVDLSSARVRAALTLLDGIRAGQPLGGLLGARFERRLHDATPSLGLGQYLPALRQFAPPVAGKLTEIGTGTAVTQVAAQAITDGLVLLTRRAELPWGQQVPGQPTGPALPDVGTAPHDALQDVLDDLAAAVDAVADLGLAEAVHQTLQGNPMRAGASLDALSRGELPPPEPEVVRTPRRGIGVTHRIALVLPDPDPADPGLARWTATPAQRARHARGRAEPRLSQWAAWLLGDPVQVRWRVEYLDGPAGDLLPGTAARTFTVADVGLCPLDVLYAPLLDPTAPGGDLERLLAWHATESAAGAEVGGVPRVLLDRDPGWPRTVLSVLELLEVARAGRELVQDARPLEPDDLLGAGRHSGVDAAAADSGLAARAAAAAVELGDALTALEVALDADPVDLDTVRAALVWICAFGVPGAAPATVVGSTDEIETAALLEQARAVASDVASRMTAAGSAGGPVAVIEAVFGRGFRALAGFAPSDPSGIRAARMARIAAGDADQGMVGDWLWDAAPTRAGVQRLRAVGLYAAAAGAAAQPELQVAQLPPPGAGSPDRWLALPSGGAPAAGRASLVLCTPFGPDLGQPLAGNLAGLLVDEWLDVIPNSTETTAIAYHVDAPANAAPQTVLLAVCPDPSRRWDLDTLEAVLLETMDAMKIRAVDPDLVPNMGHYLPAPFLATNAGGDSNGDTIATNFPTP